MKILFITNMYPASNPVFGIFVKEQIEDITNAIKCKADVHFINAAERGNIEYIKSLFSISRKIKKGSYDIIHIHYGFSGLFLLFYKPKAKTFLTLHGADILKKQGKTIQIYLTKIILKRVDKVFILNNEMEAIVKPLKINYEIIPCGVNTEFFKPLNNIKKEEKIKVIVFPGNPEVKVKNYQLFEKVIEYLNANSGFEIKQQNITNLSREGVRDLMNKADCLVMTSISEGSPQVVKEALSCGLPVVSVPVGDVKIMLDHIPDCYVSETYRVEELASLVAKSLTGERRSNDIRNAFVNKNVYDSYSVSKKIIKNYG